MKEKNKCVKIAAVAIMFLFVGASAVQAGIKTTAFNNGGTTFEWEDDFLDWSNIDTSRSDNIEINSNDEVQMVETYKAWHYPWPWMKKINIQNSGSYQPEYVMPLTVYKESEMESDYSDLRFVYVEDGNVYDLEYWVGEYNSYTADVWIRVTPGVPPGSSTVYMFYGDPSAPDHSNFDMIFMWDDRTSPDIMISHKNELEGAWDPDVDFGGGRFLVAWEERLGPEDLYNQMERVRYSDIRGRTYNSDGGDPDPDPMDDKDIEIMVDHDYHGQDASVAWGSNKFLVVWEENPANPLQPATRFHIDIKGALVSTSGGVTPLSQPICSEDGMQEDACVAYGGGKYLVVWEDARLGTNNYNVWGRFYSSTGSPSGSEFQITSGANFEGQPWVCYGNGFFLVVYEQGDHPTDGPFSLYAKKLTSTGTTVWTKQIIAGTSSQDNIWPACNYNPVTDEYFVCWNSGDLSSSKYRGSIWGNFLTQSGDLKYSNFKVQSGTNYIRADCVPYLGDLFFVSYDKADEVWGKLVYTNTIMTDEQALSDGSSLNIDWNNLAVSNDGRIFLVWEDERDQVSEYADAFGSVWHIYKSTGSPLVSYSFGSKIQLVTEATLVSKIIDPDDLDVQKWEEFFATYDMGADYCNLAFYVLDKTGGIIKNGLGDISTLPVNDIRLKAIFTRSKAASSPTIDKWGVSYMGADHDPPWTKLYKTPESPNGNNRWYKGVVDIELRGYDDSSGVKEIHYIVNNGAEQTSTDNPTTFTIRETGTHEIEYWSVDNADNVESHNYEYGIKIDSRNPKVTIVKPDTYEVDPGDIYIEATVSEEGSGLEKVELYINNDPNPTKTWTSPQDKYTYTIEDTGPGETYDIEVKAYDIAGNMGNDYTKVHTKPNGGEFAYSPEIGYLYTANGVTGPHLLLLFLSVSVVFTSKFTVKVKPKEELEVDRVIFELRGRHDENGEVTSKSGDGFFKYVFDPFSGLYDIKARMYSGSYEVETFQWPGRVFFINAL